jgi:hypothetical protein
MLDKSMHATRTASRRAGVAPAGRYAASPAAALHLPRQCLLAAQVEEAGVPPVRRQGVLPGPLIGGEAGLAAAVLINARVRHRIQVRLARGASRPPLRMRLDIDRWSSSSTAVELIPCGRVRPTAAYFRSGHLLLNSLTRHLLQPLPPAQARDIASQPRVPVGAGRP